MTGLIVITCMFAAALIGLLIGLCIEAYNWNKGKCRICGNKLRIFDYDSTGARGYECEHCYHKVWISYNYVDRRRK